MPNDVITARINAFAQELEGLVRKAAVEAVASALASARPSAPARAAAAPAPKRVSAAGRRPPKRAAGRPAAPAGASKAASQGDAAAIAYVKANPGKRLEEIAKAIGVRSPDLKGRFAELVEAKKLRKTGKTRGTKYFAV